MVNDKLGHCIKRVMQEVHEKIPLQPGMVENTENMLEVVLPHDFKELCYIHRYDYFLEFEFYNFEGDSEYSVSSQTKAIREVYSLPHEYLILSDDGVSTVLMEILPEKSARVIWCASEDFTNLLEGKPMEYNPTIFNNFVDFYEFLLDREKEIRGSEAN